MENRSEINSMDAQTSPDSVLNKLYSIPIEEFLTPPQDMKIDSYHLGDHITRGNFNDLLIKSFAASKQVREAQWGYLAWIQANSGFDSETTLRNFLEADGWNCLLPEEKKDFIDAYTQVKKHVQLHGIGTQVAIAIEIENSLKDMTDSVVIASFKESFPNLKGMTKQ